MDTGEIQNKLNSAVPSSVLEKVRFGRSDHLSLWVEGRSLPKIAAYLKSQAKVEYDWLENLSAIQMDKAIVLTYFLRSTTQAHRLILRVSVEPSGPAREADLPSVADAWAMATPFENEIQELFGVRFLSAAGEPVYREPNKLAPGWNGFPLRKTYVFPTGYLGISHSRKNVAPEGNA